MRFRRSIKVALLSACLTVGAEVGAGEYHLCLRDHTFLSEVWFGAPDDMISFSARREADKFKVSALMREGEAEEYNCELIHSGDADASGGIRCASYNQSLSNLKKGIMMRSISARTCDITKDSELDKEGGVPNRLGYVSTCSSVHISTLEKEDGVEKDLYDLDTHVPMVETDDWISYYGCNVDLPSAAD